MAQSVSGRYEQEENLVSVGNQTQAV
jgi:hypothetical protein